MMVAIRKCSMLLLVLTLSVCLVQCRPADRVKRRSCREGMVDLAGDCIPVKTVKSLGLLLCELSRYMSKDNPLSGLDKFCIHTERRIWGNHGFLDDEDSREDEKRAWWHSGLKPDRR
ncbi:uncharacterized protein LOC135478056 [Liolophura sinensis]|uniref:uncharacterized protein LOC135478056 n=1 Tax=Liolophura sinensis TaxID=3198878 RepID=UPI0031583547